MHFDAPMPFMSSNIGSLSLKHTSTSNDAMFELLEATKQLQSFNLYGARMNNYMLKASLLATAKDTLESLRLRSKGIESEFLRLRSNGIDELRGLDRYLGTLRSFQALHTLEVDEDMLVMPTEGPPLSHLDAILPSSLRSLTIWCQELSFDDIDEEFNRLLDADIGRAVLPNLKQVVLSGLEKREISNNKNRISAFITGFGAHGTYYHSVNGRCQTFPRLSHKAPGA